jgi:probable phosphoglycerate mutase
MTLVYLIRHGENEYTRTGKLAGWTPGVHLNEAGQKQAQALAEKLKGKPIKAIYASPLERTRETAAPIAAALKLDVQLSPDLGEVRYGKWQGQSLKRLARHKLWRVVQALPSAMVFPDGEALRAVQARAVNAIEKIVARHPKDAVGVVSHADVIKLLIAHYAGMPLDLFQRIGVGTASISVLRLGHGQPALVKLNDTHGVEIQTGKPHKRAARPRR